MTPNRWYAECGHCGNEAFGYVGYFRPVNEFKGAEVYKRGEPWWTITEKMIKNKEVVCAYCNKRITQDDIKVCKERLTVAALMRLVDNIGKYLTVIREEQAAISRLIEYGFIINLSPDKWKEMLKKNGVNISNIESVAKSLYERAIGFPICDDCGDPLNPTDLIRKAIESGVPIK